MKHSVWKVQENIQEDAHVHIPSVIYVTFTRREFWMPSDFSFPVQSRMKEERTVTSRIGCSFSIFFDGDSVSVECRSNHHRWEKLLHFPFSLAWNSFHEATETQWKRMCPYLVWVCARSRCLFFSLLNWGFERDISPAGHKSILRPLIKQLATGLRYNPNITVWSVLLLWAKNKIFKREFWCCYTVRGFSFE